VSVFAAFLALFGGFCFLGSFCLALPQVFLLTWPNAKEKKNVAANLLFQLAEERGENGRPCWAQQAKKQKAISQFSIVHVKVLKTARDLLHKRTQQENGGFEVKYNCQDIFI